MNNKQKFIAGAMALTLITSAAPMSVSAKAKANYSIKKPGGNSRLLVSEQAVVP